MWMNPDTPMLGQGMKCDGLFPSVRVTEKRGLVVEIGQTVKIAMNGLGSENMDAPCGLGMMSAP